MFGMSIDSSKVFLNCEGVGWKLRAPFWTSSLEVEVMDAILDTHFSWYANSRAFYFSIILLRFWKQKG